MHMKLRSYAEGSYLTNLQELARPKAQHRALGRAAASSADPEGNQKSRSMGCGQRGVLAPVTTDFLIQKGAPLRGRHQDL